jgi:hypothetical protein
MLIALHLKFMKVGNIDTNVHDVLVFSWKSSIQMLSLPQIFYSNVVMLHSSEVAILCLYDVETCFLS